MIGVAIAWGLAIVGTLVILKIVRCDDRPARDRRKTRVQGLDLSQHGEEGYYWEVLLKFRQVQPCIRLIRNQENAMTKIEAIIQAPSWKR